MHDDYALEASADEKLEEEQDAKIRYIQKKFRSRRARRFVRELVLSAYAKEYDSQSGAFHYRNKRTGATQQKKPLVLGDDDLPDPTIYYAPTGYQTTPSPFRQFALVAHCTEFADRKLPNLPNCLINDHRTLRHLIVNPYVMKYREEDCIFSLNATAKAVLASLKMLLEKIQIATNIEKTGVGTSQESQLVVFIYVCTHSVQIMKSVHRATYFCFTDTNASSPGLLRQTSISVRQFTQILARMKCQSKFVVLDCCHCERPTDSFLKVLHLYPQSDLYRTVANKGKCQVLGSCKLGPSCSAPRKSEDRSTLQSYRQLFWCWCRLVPSCRRPAYRSNTTVKDAEMYSADKSRGRSVTKDEWRNLGESMREDSGTIPSSHSKSKSVLDTCCLSENAAFYDSIVDRTEKVAAPVTTLSTTCCVRRAIPQQPTRVLTVPIAEERRKLLPKLSLPKMRLMVDPSGAYYVVDEIDQIRSWPRQFWERIHARVSNACTALKRRIREHWEQSSPMRSPRPTSYEVACYGNQYSVFGSALIHAFQGQATALPEPRLSVRLVSAHVCCDVTQSFNIDTKNATKEGSQCRSAAHCENVARRRHQNGALAIHQRFQLGFSSNDMDPSISKRHQTPQIATTRVAGEQFAIATVGCVPSVPPAPHAPRSLKARDRTVLLSWENPAFSGAPPIQYELQYRGTAKCGSSWAPCCSFATITTTSFPVPHLVPGFGVRFRVRARNFGGWGQWSEPSDRIVPVERTVESTAVEMRLATSKGLPKVIKAMQMLATNSEAQKLGAWQLIAAATKPGGFRRACHARDSAQVMLQAMRTFVLDAEVQARGCLLLGWCFYRHRSVAIEYQQAALQIVSRACSNFPADIAVVSNAVWASSQMSSLPAVESQPSTNDTDLLKAARVDDIHVKAGAR